MVSKGLSILMDRILMSPLYKARMETHPLLLLILTTSTVTYLQNNKMILSMKMMRKILLTGFNIFILIYNLMTTRFKTYKRVINLIQCLNQISSNQIISLRGKFLILMSKEDKDFKIYLMGYSEEMYSQ
jgi:hypothetical protein